MDTFLKSIPFAVLEEISLRWEPKQKLNLFPIWTVSSLNCPILKNNLHINTSYTLIKEYPLPKSIKKFELMYLPSFLQLLLTVLIRKIKIWDSRRLQRHLLASPVNLSLSRLKSQWIKPYFTINRLLLSKNSLKLLWMNWTFHWNLFKD